MAFDLLSTDTMADDQPDTPAPVFAARALRRAVFGTPQPATEVSGKTTNQSQQNDLSGSPSKPQGILLTPGTATSKRKRVSFGHQVPKSKGVTDLMKEKAGDGQRRTKLHTTLERAQKTAGHSKTKAKKPAADSDSEWEEDDDGEDACNHDITIDLNEPHSQSGRFWKEEYYKYQQEAKAEMAKLLQYKQLAKSYAHQKDTEAIQLTEQLKTEQQKVISMEKKIAESTYQMLAKQQNGQGDVAPEDLSKLTKYTALVVHYKQQVQGLELKLAEKELVDGDNTLGRLQEPSPRTRGMLLETQRELRRARAQVKELDKLRLEVKSLKTKLREAQRNPSGEETKPVNARTQLRELREQLHAAKEESAVKDRDMRKLKAEFEQYQQDAEMRDENMKLVLDRAQTKITELKMEAKEKNTTKASGILSSRARTQDFESDSKAIYSKTRLVDESPKKSRRGQASKADQAAENIDIFGAEEDEHAEIDRARTRSGTLRDRFREDRALQTKTNQPLDDASSKWQPFVPRSPKNRAYLGERLEGKIANGGMTPAALRSTADPMNDLVTLGKAISRGGRAGDVPEENEEAEVDVLKERFARLSEKPARKAVSASSKRTSSKRHLSADQRAAVLARIEERMAKRRSEQANLDLQKENVKLY